jgi:hypothetical protein
VGASERFAEPRPDRPSSRTRRGRSSRTRELPKCARRTRGVFSSSGRWCGLIRSGCTPVHRGCLRFSSKTLSRTREPLAVSIVAQGFGGYPQRHSGHQLRACPVGGPGDTRRLGEPGYRLHALDRDLIHPQGRARCKPFVRVQVPTAFRASPFLWYSPTARRGAAASWVDRAVIHRRAVIRQLGYFARAGRPVFPCPRNFGA